MAAPEIKTFGNGVRYVPAGGWAQCFAWLIDFTVFVLGVLAGVVTLALVDRSRPLGGGVIALGMVALLFAVPLLYGLFYTNGRALGALVTGTRLVRIRDGGRIGAAGPWAMVVRTILLPLLILAALSGGGTTEGTVRRVSIDVARSRRLTEGVLEPPPGGRPPGPRVLPH
ncbi:hypothetical protein GCM10029992_49590 [Glycomyces albus]